jgi:hypothetical protein
MRDMCFHHRGDKGDETIRRTDERKCGNEESRSIGFVEQLDRLLPSAPSVNPWCIYRFALSIRSIAA